MNRLAEAWRERGQHRTLCGHRIFTVDVPARGSDLRPPLLVLHGFPTSSFDFSRVVDRLADGRRVLLFDMLGYGMSDKPDRAYTFSLQADIAMAFLAELAQLSAGQEFLLGLPDERLPVQSRLDQTTVMAGVASTFSPTSEVDEDELSAQWEMIAHLDGDLLLPRLIRYIDERRSHEPRFTGAIEQHPSPLVVVWGEDDPIALPVMTNVLCAGRTDIRRHLLNGVGHYPMVEAPDRFLDALEWTPPRG